RMRAQTALPLPLPLPIPRSWSARASSVTNSTAPRRRLATGIGRDNPHRLEVGHDAALPLHLADIFELGVVLATPLFAVSDISPDLRRQRIRPAVVHSPQICSRHQFHRFLPSVAAPPWSLSCLTDGRPSDGRNALTRDERQRGMERAGLAAMSTGVCDRAFLKGPAGQDTEGKR